MPIFAAIKSIKTSNMATLIEKAAEILARCETVVITSINQEGYPRPVPMSNIKSEGATTVWLATGKDSLTTKVQPIRKQVCAFRKKETA